MSSGAAPAQTAPTPRSARDDGRRGEEEKKQQFMKHFKIENARAHPSVTLFVEKYYTRRPPYSTSEELALKIELLRLLSEYRQQSRRQ
ncbi:small capsid protein [Proboscivirus elephantidbeta4]|uniref:Small capsomere-interacting protein n=1 Tax=Elephant endotheliotropic herpesvirus 4 TaxID=548914 RepID=A0A0S1TQQ4_9BETA|nr:small capsid protein [Elephant endotheliotropic herpesvirus 4]ALM25988.1 small capsid protein [Elephant endotheliotropic herpesvirus 4]